MEVLQQTRLQTMLSKSGGDNATRGGGFTLDGDYVYTPGSGGAVNGGASGGACVGACVGAGVGACDNVGASENAGASILTIGGATGASSDKKRGFTLDGDYVDVEQGFEEQEEQDKPRYIGIRGLDGSM